MSTLRQLVQPRLGTVEYSGRCLPFAQAFFGAPARHDYARQAWDATAHKHGKAEPIPQDVSVLLWFDHWGTYFSYSKGVWEYVNAGHVVANVPGVGIYTSPARQHQNAAGQAVPAQEIYATIAQIESIFGATYIGWTEDINGVRFAELTSSTPVGQEDEDDMPDSMYAVVDGVPSWCWINWATGRVFACHTQKEADWIASYMGSVKSDWGQDKAGGEKYKNKLALLGILAPAVEISGSLTEADLARLREHVQAGVNGALAGLTLKAEVGG